MLSTTVTLTGTSGGDAFYAVLDPTGKDVQFYVNATPAAGTPVQTVAIADLAGVVVNGGGGSDSLTFDAAGVTVPLDASGTTALALTVGAGTVQMSSAQTLIAANVAAGSTLELTGPLTITAPVALSGTLKVDNGGSAGATTLDGSVTVGGLAAGPATIDVASGTLSVPGSLTVTSGVTVGVAGTGTLAVGGTLTVQDTSTVDQTGQVTVSAGSLAVGNGWTTGTYKLDGGSLSTGYLQVGSFSSGYVMQGPGTTLTASDAEVGSYGYGEYDQTGGTSHLNGLSLGYDYGTGVLNVSGGTVEATGYLNVGSSYGNGTVNLFGTGTLASQCYESFGDGTGTASVNQTGGTNDATYGLYVSGSYTLAGGSVTAGWLYVGQGATGTFTMSAGTVSTGQEVLGFDTTYTGGQTASGTWTQTGGTDTVAAAGLWLGVGAGGTGSYSLGGGSLTTGNLFVGAQGSTAGTYDQTGGTASASTLIVGLQGSGRATVSGGTLAMSANAYVGYSGPGLLAISGTGTVSDPNDALYVSGDGVDGDPAGSGTMTLADSAQLTTQQTYVGYSGPATFDQTGGTDTTQALVLNGPSGRYANYSATGGTVDAAQTVNVQRPSTGGLGVVNEGSPYTLALSGNSTVGNNAITSWQVGWGDNHSDTISGNPSSATHTYDAGGNTYTITPTAYGGGKSYPAGPVSVLVNDVPASVTAPSDLSNNVGQTTQLSATFTDPGVGETHTAIIEWGDGTPATTATVTTTNGTDAISAGHVYQLHGTYPAELIVTDSGGAVSTVPFTVSVAYVAPSVSVTAAAGVVATGQSALLTLHDGGPEATAAVTSWDIDWGDQNAGGTEDVQVFNTDPASGGSLAGAAGDWTVGHAYAQPGTYAVHATAVDSAGGHDAGSDSFVVDQPASTIDLAATPDLTDGWINLAWNDVSGEQGFQVYRGTSTGDMTAYGPQQPTGTVSFQDLQAVRGTTYYYAVAPLDASLSPGPTSAPASASLPADSPRPTATATAEPVLVSSVTSSTATFVLQNLPVTPGYPYITEYGTDPTFGVYQTAGPYSAANLYGLTPGTTYYARVRIDGSDPSYTSPISFVTASANAPAAPQFIYTRPLSATQVEVTWPCVYLPQGDQNPANTQAAPPAETPLVYAIEYTTDGMTYTTAATVPLSDNPYVSRYVVGGLQMGATYVFRLRVIDTSAGGGQSGSITSTSSASNEMMGNVPGWLQTQPVDTTGWYNLSFASVSPSELTNDPTFSLGQGLPGYPTSELYTSATDQSLHGAFDFETQGNDLLGDPVRTFGYVVYDMTLPNSRVWAASPMAALTEGVSGTVTVYATTQVYEFTASPGDPQGGYGWVTTSSVSAPIPLQQSGYFHPHAPHYESAGETDSSMGDMSPMASTGDDSGPMTTTPTATPAAATMSSGVGSIFKAANILINDARADGEYFFCGQCCNTSPFVSIILNFLQPTGKGGGDPVDLENGTFQHVDADLTDNTTAYPFGQERSVQDDDLPGADDDNGTAQVDDDLPQVVQDPGGQGYGVQLGGDDVKWFYANAFAEGGYPTAANPYQPTFDGDGTLTVNNPQTITYAQADRTQYQFYGFDGSVANSYAVDPVLQGQFLSRTDPDGTVSMATYDADGQLTEVDRYSPAQGMNGTLDSFVYCYYAAGPSAGLLQSVTWQTRPTAASPWAPVRTVTYDYYAGPTTSTTGDYIGGAGDLETAAVTDGAGDPIGTTYYRYAQVSTPTGMQDRMSYVFQQQAYARLAAAVPNPLTAADAAAAPYASLILAYDGQGRVQSQQVAGMGASAAGGQGTYSFAYSVNPQYVTTLTTPAVDTDQPCYWIQNYPRRQSQLALNADGTPATTQDAFDPAGTDLPDYNTWWYKAVVTQPDGSTDTTYLNAAGEPMLDVVTAATGGVQWATYDEYDNDGRLILQAEPSAVTGYDPSVEQSPSLTVNAQGRPLLSPNSGLIETVQYALANDNYHEPIGLALQPHNYYVQQGTNDPAPVLVETDTYDFQYGVPRVVDQTTYRNGSGANATALGASTTQYDYDDYGADGTLPTYVGITEPLIPTSEDGSDAAAMSQRSDDNDSSGRPISFTDGDGYTQTQTYDPVSGAIATQTLDAGTGGQDLKTTTTSDPLGRPTSVTDANGNVTYYTYDDADHEVRAYPGWHEVGTTGTYTTTGPVEVYREDWAQGYTETLTYAAPVLAQSVPLGNDPITGLKSLDRQFVDAAGQVVADDSYFDLAGLAYSTAPVLGTLNANYYQTTYGYDVYGRQNVVTAPTGTITENVYNAQDWLTQTLVGTSPSNLTDVADYQYDDGGSGDGDLTKVTLHAGAGRPDQVTSYGYDWRDRQVVEVDGPVGSAGSVVTYTAYDNWDLPTSVATYAGAGYAMTSTGGVPDAPAATALRSLTAYKYDEQGRVYQSTAWAVDQSTGAVGAAATTNYWYDGRGNVVAMEDPTGLWTKSVYDGAGRLVETYQTDGAAYLADVAAGVTDAATLYAAATGVAADHVLSQTTYAYDGDGDVTETVESDRLPTDADTLAGGLAGDGVGTVPARVSYAADYYDADDRLTAEADFGTAAPTAAQLSAVPTGSAALLVTAYAYDAAGNVASVTDPKGLVTAYAYDALGRVTETVADDIGNGTPTDSTNQTTAYAYNGDDEVTSMTAVLPAGQPSQTTDYVYGVSNADGSGIEDDDLLRAVWYPDPTTGQAISSQAEDYTYDDLGEQASYTDRNGTTHAYTYDALGRLTSDQVTAFGAGVDQSVASLGYTYTDAGQLATATSYDGNGDVVNQTAAAYDGFGQLASVAQAVSGAVTPSTPTVGYMYDPTHGDRQTGMTYPDGRTITYNYAAGLDASVSRLSSISDAGGTIRSYGYQGLNEPLTATDGNGVTQTTTLDGLGRIASLTDTNGSGVTVDGQSYTYDADGNVLSDRDAVLPGQSELYTYDGLNRLTGFTRGTLNGAGTAVTGTPTGTESWSLDALGNWAGNTVDGVTTTRTNDAQNRVTTVTTPATGGGNTTATLGYDKNGNTLTDESGQQYVYDAWDRLVAVKNSAGTILAAYTYDAQGRRVTETHGSATTALYYDDNWQVVEERQAGQTTAQYVWDPNGTDQLIERDDQPNAQGTFTRRLYAEQDADGNVTSLTDASGTVVERYAYDPYGAVTVLNPDGTVRGDGTAASSQYGWVVLHQGLRLDLTTGTYANRFREDDPALGRFLQQDPAGYVDGPSRYQYEASAPAGHVDPLGLWSLMRYIYTGDGNASDEVYDAATQAGGEAYTAGAGSLHQGLRDLSRIPGAGRLPRYLDRGLSRYEGPALRAAEQRQGSPDPFGGYLNFLAPATPENLVIGGPAGPDVGSRPPTATKDRKHSLDRAAASAPDPEIPFSLPDPFSWLFGDDDSSDDTPDDPGSRDAQADERNEPNPEGEDDSQANGSENPYSNGGDRIPDSRIQDPPIDRGLAPTGDDGNPIELHHRNQNQDDPLDEMTQTDHRGPGNFSANHPNTGQHPSNVNSRESQNYWNWEWDNGRWEGW